MPQAPLPTFEERLPEIELAVNKRKRKWTLAAMEWGDARSIIISRVFVQMQKGKFVPEKGPFSHWLSKVISNAMYNILRDASGRFQRPCVKGCPFNTGDDNCSKTSTGKQCGECLAYKLWERRKKSEFAIQQPLPIGGERREEVYSMPTDTVDVLAAKRVMDEKMCEYLTERDCIVYRTLYIDNLSEEEAGRRIGFVTKKDSRMFGGYLQVLEAKKRIVLVAKQLIESEGLAD